MPRLLRRPLSPTQMREAARPVLEDSDAEEEEAEEQEEPATKRLLDRAMGWYIDPFLTCFPGDPVDVVFTMFKPTSDGLPIATLRYLNVHSPPEMKSPPSNWRFSRSDVAEILGCDRSKVKRKVITLGCEYWVYFRLSDLDEALALIKQRRRPISFLSSFGGGHVIQHLGPVLITRKLESRK